MDNDGALTLLWFEHRTLCIVWKTFHVLPIFFFIEICTRTMLNGKKFNIHEFESNLRKKNSNSNVKNQIYEIGTNSNEI